MGVLLLLTFLVACTETNHNASPPRDEAPRWQTVYTRPVHTGDPLADVRVVGDVMLGRFVAQSAERSGYTHPFAAMQTTAPVPPLNGTLLVGNLESPLTSRTDTLRPGPYRLPAPPAFAPTLRDAGFDVLSLANNHALDAGAAGLQESISLLQTHNIIPIGAGADSASAHAPALISTGALTVGVLAFNDVPDPDDHPDEAQGWGRAWLDETTCAAVEATSRQADAVMVLVHWGEEYMQQPTSRQREWATRLVDAGADLVIGSHPHVVQPIEMLHTARHSGLVAYSLGNFIFDQPYDPSTSSGMVLRALLDHDGVVEAQVVPVGMVAMQVRYLTRSGAWSGEPDPIDGDVPQVPTLHPTTALSLPLSLPAHSPTLHPMSPPTPTPQPAAWTWDGTTALTVALTCTHCLAERPTRIAADLRGNGEPLWATLNEDGVVEVRDGPAQDAPLVWHNEADTWRITRMDVGDPNDDGRIELLLLLWKPDEEGVVRSHPFLMGWRGGYYRIIWGGSATTTPIQDIAVADMDRDGRSELVVLEGGQHPGDAAQAVSVWHWHGWGFQHEWGSPAGNWHRLSLHDVTGDTLPDIVVE